MTESELRELIRGIVAEMLAAPPRPNALVLFSGALLGFDTAVASLKRLVGDVNLNWTQTPRPSSRPAWATSRTNT